MTSVLRSRRTHIGAAAVAAITATTLYFAYSIGFWHIDLEVYRFAVWTWWDGGDVYGPLPRTDGGRGLSLPFIYPPFAVLTAVPFAVVPWTLSFGLLFALSLACVFGTLYLVARRTWPSGGRDGALLVATAGVPVALALEPVRDTFFYGQVNLLLMGLVAADCLARHPRWPRGIGVGIAAAVKLTPAVFVLFFLVRKDYRAAAVATLTGVIATGIGFLSDWHGSLTYWFEGFGQASRISGSTYRTNQTITAMFARFGLEQPVLTVVAVLVVLALLAAVVVAMRRAQPVVALLLCAAFALLAAPTSWSHTWVWAVPALAVMLVFSVRAVRSGSAAGPVLLAGTAATAAAFVLAPFQGLPGNDDWNPVEVDLEQTWTPLQHLAGNAYVLLAVAWILGCAIAAGRRGATASPVRGPADASTVRT